MTRALFALLMAAFLIPSIPQQADARVLNRACQQSERDAANRSLCRCIQKVANRSLSRADQRLAASFIKEPHKAQEIRQSDSRSHEIFWKRYKAFGEDATRSCNHLR
ncbi:hypothetical protein [Shimia sp. R9_3]|uniref:hypothetical protein n=1 Tax=Shimia sp. R9_3 TaxID=2821113 RepID=UPI001FFE16F8|nr:hypothetical protein [Shimia sp. R9_3]